MDTSILKSLACLLRSQRVAALGTLREGAPFVSMVLYAEAPDLSAFWLHLSRLAVHSRAIQSDAHVALLVAQPDIGSRDPQILTRVSLQGQAAIVVRDTTEYEAAKALYLAKFPASELNFALRDFDLYRVVAHGGRYVADFGKIYDLNEADLRETGRMSC